MSFTVSGSTPGTSGPNATPGPGARAARGRAHRRTIPRGLRTLCVLASACAASGQAGAAGAPWWEVETALDADGRLAVPLPQRSWWPRAQALEVGESMLLVSEHDGRGRMLVRREVGTPVPYEEPVYSHIRTLLQEGKEMLVWILDDDGDMDPAAPEPDRDSDAYVVDYGADGIVDRVLDYVDEDGDGDPGVMDLRYFQHGALRHAIVQLDLDDDGHQYPVHDYQRIVGNRLSFLIDAYGDNMFYHNKYDPGTQGWVPLGECPFAFHDPDGDDASERAVRVSAAPLDFNATTDPDFANSWARMMGPFEPIMRRPGAMAVRYSLDVDGGSSATEPLHYEMGFHMNGELAYDTASYRLVHELRRPPRVSFAVPHERTVQFAESYPATRTGFSWREFADATVDLGDWRGRVDYDQRWEGVFWTWHRRVMHNTGGPTQYWNVRREYDGDRSSARLLYYSPVDHRLHLKGAEEGWLPIGAIEDAGEIGEIRMFDTTGDGYFDRWEYWRPGAASPYRTARVPDADNRDLGVDPARAGRLYVEGMLPAALGANQRLIEALQAAAPALEVPAELRRALESTISDVERLYILDIARETLYARFGEMIGSAAAAQLTAPSVDWLPHHPEVMQQQADAWTLSATKARLDAVYERGDFDAAAALIAEMRQLTVACPTNASPET
jgi:hypothetical protein